MALSAAIMILIELVNISHISSVKEVTVFILAEHAYDDGK